jgi:glucose/arabinose dehydrogenase
MSRSVSQLLAIAWIGLLASIPCAAAAEAGLFTERVASGFTEPVFVTSPTGDGRLFVVERAGLIRIFASGSTLPTPFLDITSLVKAVDSFGFFGLAFAPDYATSGLFYVYYTNFANESVIARYHVSANPDVADAGSGETVLAIAQPGTDHNGGTIAFSPDDGYLYFAPGDGGTGPYDPLDNAQDPQELLGKMLRIDVGGGVGTPYSVPTDNPFVADAGVLDEVWSFGLRNPFRWSFDRLTGDLWMPDRTAVRAADPRPRDQSCGGGLKLGGFRKES